MIKPIDCYGCPLQKISNSFSLPEGLCLNGVLIMGEGLGHNEAIDGLPFRQRGAAGSLLEQVFRICRTDRTQFLIDNIVRCFASPRAGVFTEGGYKEINKVIRGDRVLTHLGRFRDIKHLIRNRGVHDCIEFMVESRNYRLANQIQTKCLVSKEHIFQSEGEWKHTWELDTDQYITMLGEYCVECNNSFYRHFKKRNTSLPFCSVVCHNKFVARKGASKMREIMYEAYKTGKRDPYKVTQAANETIRELVKQGWKPTISDEGRHSQRLKASLTRQAIGLESNGNYIGKGEIRLAAILEAGGYDFQSQFALNGYNFDFKLTNSKILIELDGASSENIVAVVKQTIKDESAKAQGYSVIHIKRDKVENILNILDNDNHDYPFLECKILGIRKRTWNTVYTLSVDEDESYVGMGTISHNCQPPNDNLHGFGYEHDAIEHCTRAYSHRVYGDSRVRAILALGGVAFRNISGLAGKKLGISDVRGYVVRNSKFDVPIIGSYHPSHIRRGKLAFTDYLIHDLRKVMGVASGRYKNYCDSSRYPQAKYQLNPSLDDAKSYFYKVKDNPNLNLAYDIETPNSAEMEEDERDEIIKEEITSIQFSMGKGEGIWMPWEGDYVKVAKAILKRGNRKLCFNGWNFDNPKLAANNTKIMGVVVDLMWKFHYLKPDLEMGLQKVASMCDFPFFWKHFAKDERMQRFYGVVDVDVLHWIEPKIDKILESMKVPI